MKCPNCHENQVYFIEQCTNYWEIDYIQNDGNVVIGDCMVDAIPNVEDPGFIECQDCLSCWTVSDFAGLMKEEK